MSALRLSVALPTLCWLAIACTETGSGVQEVPSERGPNEGPIEQLTNERSEELPTVDRTQASATLQDDPLTRIEQCEVDEATQSRIDQLTEQLAELRLTYAEGHPDVVRTRQLLDDLARDVLSDCVEDLQRPDVERSVEPLL